MSGVSLPSWANSLRDPAIRASMRAGFGRRIALLRRPWPETQPVPSVRLFLREFLELPLVRRRNERDLDVPASADPRVIMMLPGFATDPNRMRYLSRAIEMAGHKVKRWGLGWNLGPTPERFEKLERRLERIYRKKGTKIILVGWSLGGLFARELAKRQPDKVAGVITMGTPFSGSPHANNLWRLYELVAGHPVDEPPIDAVLAEKPPVPTIALWSPKDGVIHHRCACGKPGERDKAIALRCTHMGFSYSKEAIHALLHEIEQLPAGEAA